MPTGEILEKAVDATLQEIRKSHRLPVFSTETVWHGQTLPALRITEGNIQPSFEIALGVLPLEVAAMLLPDSYGGAFVRQVARNAQDQPEVWVDLIESGNTDGIFTKVFVNQVHVDPPEFPTGNWRSLEIACHLRVEVGSSSEELAASLLKVTSLCMDLVAAGLDLEEHHEPAEGAPEGFRTTVTVNRYERSEANRRACITYFGCFCWVCDLDFRERYGELGTGYIQVHHIVPVATMGPGYRPDPHTELVPLCSNCHSMIHNGDVLLSPPELREILGLETKSSPWD